MIPELADALHLDFETRSTVDLRQAGPYVYAENSLTEVWVSCFARGDGPVEVWRPGEPPPATIVGAYRDGAPWVSHNAAFERAILSHIMGPRFGWPVPPLQRWWCTAAMAAALALPRDLARAGEVLGLPIQKDDAGAKVMRAMMRPYRTERVPCWLCGSKTCGHPEQFKLNLFYREEPELVARGIEYCKRDVETERELCRHIRPLPPRERAVWLLDQLINERGVMIDLPAVANAQKIVAEAMKELNERAVEVTGGYLTTQAQKLKWWCNFEGVNLSDLRRETIRDLLLDDDTLDDNVRKALELRQEAAKTSTAKLTAFQRRACADGRMRDNLMYHGSSTGRFSGRGAQVQNLPARFTLKSEQKELGAELIQRGVTADQLRRAVGESPLEVISASLRGMIIAGPGKEFTVGDFNAIEARGTAWLAGAEGMLEAFRTGKDVYRRQAGLIYGLDPEEAQRLPRDGRERQLGKISSLAMSYQMGADKFISTCWKERILISKPEAVQIVSAYRDGNPEIPQLWRELEEAAFEDVRYPERIVTVAGGRIAFARRGTWLYMRLPSGRLLSYAHPQIKKKQMPWLDESTGLPAERWGVVYWGVDSVTHKWCEQSMYGGKATENAVQALCRDLLVEAMLRLEAAGYPQVLSVHDEAVSEHDQGFGSVEEFQRLLCVTPDWAEGLPVEAEVWRGIRYRK